MKRRESHLAIRREGAIPAPRSHTLIPLEIRGTHIPGTSKKKMPEVWGTVHPCTSGISLFLNLASNPCGFLDRFVYSSPTEIKRPESLNPVRDSIS